MSSWLPPPRDFSFDIYLLYTAVTHGYQPVPFSVNYGGRIYGESKWATGGLKKIRTILDYLLSITRMALRNYREPENRLRIFMNFFLAGLGTGLAGCGAFLVSYIPLNSGFEAALLSGILAGGAAGVFLMLRLFKK